MKRIKHIAAIFLLGIVSLPVTAGAVPPNFVQNGNSFGAQAILGTNDNFPLVFETNNTERLMIDTEGSLVLLRAVGGSPSSGTLLLRGASTDPQPGDIRFIDGSTDIQLAQISFETTENGLTISVPGTEGTGALIISRGNGNTVIGNAFSFVPPEGTLQVVESGESTLYIGASEASTSGQSRGCMVLGDSDGAGVTYIIANDGILTSSVTKPSICE